MNELDHHGAGSVLPRAEDTPDLPLDGLLVLDFSQFLSGPSAALRLADLGARVIKVERPQGGDICRTLYVSNVVLDGDSSLFHAINRNKEGIACDLKKPADLEFVRSLIRKADVLVQNFRPGVMKRIGLGFEEVRKLNPRLVYAEITGYGPEGPWREKPGQDLLVQSLSGIPWLNGDGAGPMPLGLSIVDMAAGALLAQGILACLVRRGVTGEGGLVEVSLLEAILDAQAEGLSAFLNKPAVLQTGQTAPIARPAPYGIYETADGYMALGNSEEQPSEFLGRLLGMDRLPGTETDLRRFIAARLRTARTADWLARLEPAGWPCAEVLDWAGLLGSEAFQTLGMTQSVVRGDGCRVETTRCPIRIDGCRLYSGIGAPQVDEHGLAVRTEFGPIP